MFKRLFSVGLRDHYPEYLNRKVYHTNVVAFIFILAFAPFSYITYLYFPPLGIIPTSGTSIIVLTWFFHHWGYVHISRILMSISPISHATVYVALLTPAGEPAWGQLWTLYFTFIFIPTTIFDFREPVKLISMLGYGILLIFLWYPLNSWLELEALPDVSVWKTGWFGYWTIIMSLGIALGSVLTMMYRSSKAEEQAMQLLKRNFEIELVNAELKAVRSQFNPHFIFNALASIQQFILKNDRIQANKYLTQFSKLIRLTLNHSDRLVISLEEEYEGLTYYLEIEKMRLNKQFDYFFDHDAEVDLKQIELPSMLLQIFAENAIWHGFTPMESGGLLSITTRTKGNGVIVALQDNGVGRKASQGLQVGLKHESKGLKMTEDKINLFNRNRECPMTLEVIDLEDEAGKALGTRVEIMIPLG
ncbi:MAG TPA: hypothetical protein DCE41_13770 [Cytophagales bacterium]|nr:hypothetical protein [Cytophagales bacterium]HAA20034.1 hypothetical protein [Cytophagales bacterium]HAP60100.1 hypothetical protein [Cytophagales bacterium]